MGNLTFWVRKNQDKRKVNVLFLLKSYQLNRFALIFWKPNANENVSLEKELWDRNKCYNCQKIWKIQNVLVSF